MSIPQPDVLASELKTRVAAAGGDACRLFHGRGRCFPGLESLVVDWFEPVAFVILYGEEAERFVAGLRDRLRGLLAARLGCLVVQRRYLTGAPSEVLLGELPDPAFAREEGLTYRLLLAAGQNVGFFPDMAAGRARVRVLAPGRRVLNLFAYTCAFSVAALAGGAERVVNLDMSRNSLAVGRQNHRDNGLDLRRASFLAHDVLKSFGKLGRLGPFDLAVIDPPTQQGGSFRAERDWPKLLRRLPELLSPGADVVACLNAPHLPAAFLTELSAQHLPGATLLTRLDPPPGFPERDPERGLKVLHYRV